MNKIQAKRAAYALAAKVLQSTLDTGWPFNELAPTTYKGVVLEDEDGNPNADGERLEAALNELVEHLISRGGV